MRASSFSRISPLTAHDFIYLGPRDPSARSAKPSAQSGSSDMIAHMRPTSPNPTGGSQTTSSWISVSGR